MNKEYYFFIQMELLDVSNIFGKMNGIERSLEKIEKKNTILEQLLDLHEEKREDVFVFVIERVDGIDKPRFFTDNNRDFLKLMRRIMTLEEKFLESFLITELNQIVGDEIYIEKTNEINKLYFDTTELTDYITLEKNVIY